MAEALLSAVAAAGTIAAAMVFGRGARRLRQRGRGPSPPRLAAVAVGLAAVAAAVSGPVPGLAHASLTAHMVQHLLLTAVAGPLLGLSRPGPAVLAGLPVRMRRAVTPLWRRIGHGAAGPRWLGVLAASAVLHVVTLVGWHAPVAYEAALGSDVLHAGEHTTLLGTAVLFWWAVAGAGQPSRSGAGVLAVFVTLLPANALGAAMTLSGTPWYSPYAGGDALVDQQVAGALMWAGAGALNIVAAVAVFATWLASVERRSPSQLPMQGRV